MIKAIKIRLLPSLEQEVLMKKSVGTARFAYNFGLAKWQELYKEGAKPTGISIKKIFNNTIKKQEEYNWLKEVSAQITAQAFADLQNSFNNFFNGRAKYPRFKTRKKSRQSFYVRYDSIIFKDNTVNIEKIGRVKYKTNYKIPKLKNYVNPRCSFDGKYWYLTFGFEHGENQAELDKDLSIGIDLGVTNLAVVSHMEKPIKNINKISKVKNLEKKLKRLQRKVSRKYEMNKDGTRFVKTNNIIKLEKQIKLIHRNLTNIRTNHIHQATSSIVKLKPYRIVMEDLNISGMMKNKHLSKAIQQQKFYEFLRQMKYKCKFNSIDFIQAAKPAAAAAILRKI